MVLVMAEVPITNHSCPGQTRIRVITLGLDMMPDDRPFWVGGHYKWHLRDEVHQWFLDMNIPYGLVVSPDPTKPERDTFKVSVADQHELIVRLRWYGAV